MPFGLGIMPGEHDWMKRVGWGGVFGQQDPAAQGVPGTTPPTGSWADRFAQRLESPGAQLGLRILAANQGGQSLGNVLGNAALGYQQDKYQRGRDDLQNKMLEAQIENMRRGGVDAESYGQPQTVIGPDGKPRLVQFSDRGASRPIEGYAPSPLEQYGRVNPGDYTPESLAKYAETRNFGDLVRVWAPTVDTIGGVPTMTGRQVGGGVAPGGTPIASPLSTIERESAAKAAMAAAEQAAVEREKTAAVIPRAAAEQQATRNAAATGARSSLELFKGAEDLIDKAPAGLADRGALALSRAAGIDSDSADAQAKLESLSLNAVLDRIKSFGANPTEGERAALLSSLGDLSNPKKTRGERKAALGQTRKILEAIEARGSKPAKSAAERAKELGL